LIVLGVITVLLVAATIVLTLKLLDQSERHVEAVHGMKVKSATDAGWAPRDAELDGVVKADYDKDPNRTKAGYHADISDKGMRILGKMKNLTNLDLAGCNVEDDWLQYIQDLHLTRLALSDSEITDRGARMISKFTDLADLTLARCTKIGDQGISSFKSLKKLTCLDLEQTQCTNSGVKILCDNLPNLTVLKLKYTKVTSAALADIAKLKNLDDLDLSQNEIDRKDLVHLAGLKKLTKLGLNRCNITDEDIPFLASLGVNSLGLSSTPITSKGLMILAGTKHIRQIYIEGCPNLTAADVEKLRQIHPECGVIYSRSDRRLDQLIERYGGLD